jgi:phosphoglycolate phosphatase-like HAD superfamily hydrolase
VQAIEAAQVLVDELQLHGLTTPEQFLADREEALDAMFPTAQLLPGAERLLRHLAAAKVPFCLATSSHLRHYNLKTTLHRDLFSLFSHRVTGGRRQPAGRPCPAASSTPRSLSARPAWRTAQPAAEPRTPRCHRHACSAAASTDYALSQIPN